MCTIDKYIIIEQKNGTNWCVMPEDLEDIIRAVKRYNETGGEYDGGNDELLELKTISGAQLWTLASAIATIGVTTLEQRARRDIIDDRMAVETEEEKQRILREESLIRAATR